MPHRLHLLVLCLGLTSACSDVPTNLLPPGPADSGSSVDAKTPSSDGSVADAVSRDASPVDGARADAGGLDAELPDQGNWTDPPVIECLSPVTRACGQRLVRTAMGTLPEQALLRDLMSHDNRIYALQEGLWRSDLIQGQGFNFRPAQLQDANDPRVVSISGGESRAIVISENQLMFLRGGQLLRNSRGTGTGLEALPGYLVGGELRVGAPDQLGLEWTIYERLRGVRGFGGPADRIVSHNDTIGFEFVAAAHGGVLLLRSGGRQYRVEPDNSGLEPELMSVGRGSDAHHFLMDQDGRFYEFCDGGFVPRNSPGAPAFDTKLFEHLYAPESDEEMIVAATGSGLSVSCDGGRSWDERFSLAQYGLAPVAGGLVSAGPVQIDRWDLAD